MKLLQLIAVVFTCFMMQGCGKYADGTSVWAGGLFLVPLILLIGSVIFLYKAYRASKSGSTQQTMTGGTKDVPGNVPMYKMGLFWFGVALLIALVVVVFVVNGDK